MEKPNFDLNVLLVDDDDTLRGALEDFLKHQGIEAAACRDGAEAIEIIKSRRDFFDVVITDLIMPKVGGLEVLREAREHSKETQVVIITGYASLETAIDSMHHGAFDYVTKPFKLVEIRLILEKIAERKRLVNENRTLSDRIQSLYVRLDMLKENRSKTERFMGETADQLEFQSKKIDECLNMIRAIATRIDPFIPSLKPK
jgi:DNA-binding NtrC family response regulator